MTAIKEKTKSAKKSTQKLTVHVTNWAHGVQKHLEELLKIIYVSLTNTSSFFSEPITIKNPYNNIPFDKSILFHIYIFFESLIMGTTNNQGSYLNLYFCYIPVLFYKKNLKQLIIAG